LIYQDSGSNLEQSEEKMRVGVISDTHGLLRPAAVEALANSELILHAGDIGKPEVLVELETIAPVIAVRGNNDQGEWAEAIAECKTFKIENISVHLLHIGRELNLLETGNVQVVISGHSHKPSIVERNGILFLNPGSAGPRRFKLPISVAHLQVEGNAIHAEIVELAV
jgi:putative phosphoesterase